MKVPLSVLFFGGILAGVLAHPGAPPAQPPAHLLQQIIQELDDAAVTLFPDGTLLPNATRGPHINITATLSPLANLSTPELIAMAGYPVEVHHVTTEDGYVLELHRIPYGASATPPTESLPVVFLHHGLLSSSADWIMNSNDEALAYIMADLGYDVWMANARGNTYSRSHVTLSPDDKEFWQFTWNEMAYYDVPADIDYILALTGRSDVYYVGFSMGTSIFFSMMSERHEYASKIRAMAALAPVAYLEHVQGALALLAPYSETLDTFLSLFGYNEFLPGNDFMDMAVELLCDQTSVAAAVCYNFLFLIAGPSTDELNEEFLPVILAHTPAGTSTHTMNHYGQLVLSGVFGKYDWGRLGNQVHYGQDAPPLYNLTMVTPPVAFFHSDSDWLADTVDVARLSLELPNLVVNHRVEKTEFNHLDFTWALHANELVYTHVLAFLAQY